MEISSLLLNGLFGLIFAIIGYIAIIKGAKIQAEAELKKRSITTENRNEVFQRLEATKLVSKNVYSLEQIHWTWWAIYIGLIFVFLLFIWLMYPWSGFSSSEYLFWTFLFFLMVVIPFLTFRLALVHPIPWKIATAFIASLQGIILLFSIMNSQYLYSDLYEDLPMWAWVLGNIGGVIVISIQRQQQKLLK